MASHATQQSPAPAQRYNQRQRISSGVRPLAGRRPAALTFKNADDAKRFYSAGTRVKRPGEISRRSSPWRFPPWKRRDDTYFICAENLAVDRPKPERSVARGLGVVITYCRLRASISALLIRHSPEAEYGKESKCRRDEEDFGEADCGDAKTATRTRASCWPTGWSRPGGCRGPRPWRTRRAPRRRARRASPGRTTPGSTSVAAQPASTTRFSQSLAGISLRQFAASQAATSARTSSAARQCLPTHPTTDRNPRFSPSVSFSRRCAQAPYGYPRMPEIRTFCRICEPSCGLVATVEPGGSPRCAPTRTIR